ncbi:MAG: SseB family protein [Actinocatenispora sp.]
MIESWQPANNAERALLSVLRDGDTGAYFAVIARIPLYLPSFTDVPAVGGSRQFVVWNIDGTKCLLAFTSVEGMRTVLGDRVRGGLTTTYAELVEKWPNPQWRLAVNPDLPIYAVTGIRDVGRAATGSVVVPTAAQLLADQDAGKVTGAGSETPDEFRPANDTEVALQQALQVGDGDQALTILATSVLVVPTTAPVSEPFAVERPDFPWHLGYDANGTAWVPAFTSLAGLRAVLPGDTPAFQMPASTLGRCWPQARAARLVINPGSPIEFPMDGDAVPGLADWAEELLGTTMPAVPVSGEPLPPGGELHGVRRPAYEPVGQAAAPTNAGPVLVQKVLPHAAVEVYLKHGFNRVSGLVYPASSLVGATTPAALYEALALTAGETGFRDDDESVHVIRWYARCPSLYREALGAADERLLESVGGFMVEPAPFLGAGVSPGAIPALELKADAVMVPHGAQMYRLTAAGETAVAAYDADVRQWVQVSQKSIADLMR